MASIYCDNLMKQCVIDNINMRFNNLKVFKLEERDVKKEKEKNFKCGNGTLYGAGHNTNAKSNSVCRRSTKKD